MATTSSSRYLRIFGALVSLLLFSLPSPLPARAEVAWEAPVTVAAFGRTTELDEPAEAAGLADAADRAGALGLYYDWDAKQYVVIFSGGDSDALQTFSVSTSLAVRTEYRVIDREQIKAIEDDLLRGNTFATDEPYSFRFDPKTGRVLINTNGSVTEFEYFLKQYPGLVTVRKGNLQRASRTNDPNPHRGGATIINTSLGDKLCTAGFTVRKTSSGSTNMVTAGHCGGFNGAVIKGPTGVTWGPIWNMLPFPNYDLALISCNCGTGQILTGGATGTVTAVKGAANPSIGSTSYCTSGSATWETCGHHVTSLNATLCDDNGDCTGGVIEYEDGTDQKLGDSGAPFFNYRTGGGVTIRGLFFGFDPDLHTGYAERWTVVRDAFGVTIITS